MTTINIMTSIALGLRFRAGVRGFEGKLSDYEYKSEQINGSQQNSFDVVRDSLGLVRTEFPRMIYFVTGTQAHNAPNPIGIFKISNISGKRRELVPTSDDEENDGPKAPVFQVRKVFHEGGVNRIRAMTQKPHICASWGDTGFILLDVALLTLDIEIVGGLMMKLIPRNNVIPTNISQVFNTYKDQPTAVSIKLLAIKKLDNATSWKWSDEQFMELFVYEYCETGTLHESLHLNDEIHEKLSWNSRVHVALQIARALDLVPTSALMFVSVKIIAHGYGGPELESGSYTYQSDVYSFGVIMLRTFHRPKRF
ncbi:hypothetical protein M8C21_011772 [Ambrosia artemisiifolia]|uniref:Uncharacterized protein n=1 Tax=Ambrosia artemisiifolia TaxID=4212 RepID=A0AAD5GRW5_AMBAR|nr:hypothetical protein M8C21_011772 [Ambrosia artemisiifolia]